MKFIRMLPRYIVTRAGYEIIKKRKKLPIEARFGLDVLGPLVDRLVEQRGPKELFLLQIGANDGEQEDAVRPILERHEIPALLCEPISDAFPRLQTAYREFHHVQLLQCAIGATTGTLRLFKIEAGATKENSSVIASFDRQHVEMFCRIWDVPYSNITFETVPQLSVNGLLEKVGRRSVDIAAVDTEGMDHLICDQLLDLESPPTIIHFEYANSPLESIKRLWGIHLLISADNSLHSKDRSYIMQV